MNVKELLIGSTKYFFGIVKVVVFALSFAIFTVLFAILSLEVSGLFIIPLIIFVSFMISIVYYINDNDIDLW
jgi:hypothetical protein